MSRRLPCLNDNVLRFDGQIYTTLVCEVDGAPQADGQTGAVRGCRFLTADLQAGTCTCPLLDRRCFFVGERTSVGLRFREWREKAGMTRNEAALVFLHCSGQHLYQIEVGRIIPSRRIERAMEETLKEWPEGVVEHGEQ